MFPNAIGSGDDMHSMPQFHLSVRMPYNLGVMKNTNLPVAAISGVIAIAAIVISLRAPVNVETFIAYGSVLSLLALAALDYRVRWTRVLSR